MTAAARHRPTRAALAVALALACALGPGALVSCASGPAGAAGGDETSGPAFEAPAEVALSPYDPAALEGSPEAGVDASHVAQGYVVAVGSGDARLKFQVTAAQGTYTFDLPATGEPTVYPLTMGDGAYTFRIMRNTEADRYVEVFAASADVALGSEFDPFVRPSFYCSYDAQSEAVALARDLAAGAANQGDVLRAVYGYLTESIAYDTDKAARLAGTGGYVPDPDATLAAGSGICFDYASLAAAMLRSLGIPCQIVTGTVYPDDVYHAWNMVYIDGSWRCAEISVDPDTWTRIDTTFAAADARPSEGEEFEYVDRYIY